MTATRRAALAALPALAMAAGAAEAESPFMRAVRECRALRDAESDIFTRMEDADQAEATSEFDLVSSMYQAAILKLAHVPADDILGVALKYVIACSAGVDGDLNMELSDAEFELMFSAREDVGRLAPAAYRAALGFDPIRRPA